MQVTIRSEGDVLHNTLDLLQNGERWIKGTLAAVTAEGELSYCLTGALGEMRRRSANFEAYERAHYKVYAEVREKGFQSIPAFNDSPNTEWKDIEEVVNKAIASFEAPRTLSGA